MNLDFDAFTYITGLAGLLGLLLQLKDIFPEHREIRKTVVLLIIGIFVGSVITSVKGIKVDFGSTVRPFEILVALFVAVLAIVAITGAFTRDDIRRYQLFQFSGAGTFALFVLLFFGSVGETQVERERRHLNIEELLELSGIQQSHGNYDRALYFLQEAKGRIPATDERRKILDDRMREIRKKQIEGSSSKL
jgi:hypothetical protein